MLDLLVPCLVLLGCIWLASLLASRGLSGPKRWYLRLALVPLSYLVMLVADGSFDPEDFAAELLRSLAQALPWLLVVRLALRWWRG